MAETGYEAKNRKGRGFICRRCVDESGLSTDSMNKVTTEQFRDVYCVNCRENLVSSGKSEPKNVHEAVCVVLDEAFDSLHPAIDLAPGEQPEKEQVSESASFVSHPDDATEQVYFEVYENKLDNEVKPVLEALESVDTGHVRFNRQEIDLDKGDTIYRYVVVAT